MLLLSRFEILDGIQTSILLIIFGTDTYGSSMIMDVRRGAREGLFSLDFRHI